MSFPSACPEDNYESRLVVRPSSSLDTIDPMSFVTNLPYHELTSVFTTDFINVRTVFYPFTQPDYSQPHAKFSCLFEFDDHDQYYFYRNVDLYIPHSYQPDDTRLKVHAFRYVELCQDPSPALVTDDQIEADEFDSLELTIETVNDDNTLTITSGSAFMTASLPQIEPVPITLCEHIQLSSDTPEMLESFDHESNICDYLYSLLSHPEPSSHDIPDDTDHHEFNITFAPDTSETPATSKPPSRPLSPHRPQLPALPLVAQPELFGLDDYSVTHPANAYFAQADSIDTQQLNNIASVVSYLRSKARRVSNAARSQAGETATTRPVVVPLPSERDHTRMLKAALDTIVNSHSSYNCRKFNDRSQHICELPGPCIMNVILIIDESMQLDEFLITLSQDYVHSCANRSTAPFSFLEFISLIHSHEALLRLTAPSTVPQMQFSFARQPTPPPASVLSSRQYADYDEETGETTIRTVRSGQYNPGLYFTHPDAE
jgi:hypothetical protein